MQLRPYQQIFTDNIRQEFTAHTHVCGVLPTGGGKSPIAAHIAESASSIGNTVTVLVHRKELVRQLSSDFSAFNVPHGIIAPGYPETDHPVQIASVFSITRRAPRHHDLIIVDECHHVVSSTWLNFLNANPDSYVLGLTATPERLDGRGLGDVFTSLVQGPTTPELIKLCYLSEPIVYGIPTPINPDSLHTTMGDYDRNEIALEFDKPEILGDAVATYQKHAHGQKALVFCATVKQAEHTALAYRNAGIPAASIDGTMTDADRADTLTRLQSGEITVLTSCQLIGEGLNIPAVSVVQLLTCTASLSWYLQMVGRGLRPAPGKTHTMVLDHGGNFKRHGLPDDHRTWCLDSQKRKIKSQAAISLRVCPQCYSVDTRRDDCRYCLYSFGAAHIDDTVSSQAAAELIIIDKQIAAAERKQQLRRADTLAKLFEYAQSKGYKPGWAIAVHNSRKNRQGPKIRKIQ